MGAEVCGEHSPAWRRDVKFGRGLLQGVKEQLSRRVPLPLVIAFLSLCLGVGAGVGMAFLFATPEGGQAVIAGANGKGIEIAPRKARPFQPPRVVFKHGPPERKNGFGEQAAPKRSTAEQAPVAGPAGAETKGDKDTARAPSQEVAALPSATFMPVPDDRLPWRRNAVKVSNVDGRAMIAVVIDDMGLDRRRSARALGLPGPLTLAYLPYGSNLKRQTEAARAAGHELLVHVSMEPESVDEDPGPNALIGSLEPKDILSRLRWALGRFDGYVGISNHMGSKFTGDAEGMTTVVRELRSRGLMFLDSRTTQYSVGNRVARRFGVPHARRHVFLDNEAVTETVRQRLAEVEVIATHTGFAVAIGHPREATLEVLEEWLPDVIARGFALVPISAIALRERAGG
jgi:polysaccharide deacetylase 2 family uncharacterized protein YibQ